MLKKKQCVELIIHALTSKMVVQLIKYRSINEVWMCNYIEHKAMGKSIIHILIWLIQYIMA